MNSKFKIFVSYMTVHVICKSHFVVMCVPARWSKVTTELQAVQTHLHLMTSEVIVMHVHVYALPLK